MKSGYYAGIDIGTNGARLVIKDAFYNENRELEAVEVNKVRVPLRLGADVYSIGELSERKIRQLEIERMALKQESDEQSKIRLNKLEGTLVSLNKDKKDLMEQWMKEKNEIKPLYQIIFCKL